jgi:uncharacterized protein with von Willebrand factor type A (vWA) domain
LNAAKDVLENEDATAAEVTTALENLNTAFEGLIVKADKTGLQAKYEQVKDTVGTNYTASSFSAFQTALNAAKDVLENEDATAAEVLNALNNLNSAFDALETKTEDIVKKGCKGNIVSGSISCILALSLLFINKKRILKKAD